MARKRVASEGIAHIIDLLRPAFPAAEAIRYTLAVVVVRWLADLRRNGLIRQCRLELPSALEYHAPFALHEQKQLANWLTHTLAQLEALNQRELAGVFGGLNFHSPRFEKDLLTRIVGVVWSRERFDCGIELIHESLKMARAALVELQLAPELDTPDVLGQLVARLLQPQAGDAIYDPACGTGMMLRRCIDYIDGQGARAEPHAAERDRNAWTVAKLQALVAGFVSAHILHADALLAEQVEQVHGSQRRFDVVVCHPPWGRKGWRPDSAQHDRFDRFRYGMPPDSCADYAYLLHMVSSMAEDGGRMAAIVPSGVLFRGGKEGQIRARLVRDNLVDSVIALPEKSFPNTAVTGAILVLRRNRDKHEILFIDARKLAGKGALPPDTLDRIAAIAHERAGVPGLATLAGVGELEANGFSLNVPLYVKREAPAAQTDLALLRVRRATIKEELQALNHRIDALLAGAGLPEGG